MIYLLDTNVIIDLINQNPHVESELKKYSQKEFAISNITIAELWFGIEQSKSNQEKMSRLLAVAVVVSTFSIIDFNNGIEEVYGEVVSNLKNIKKYKKKDCLDYQIASTAINQNLTLVTRNPNDFKYIQGLQYATI
jgi:tRNA(fMet)-specific endonuclease VapC